MVALQVLLVAGALSAGQADGQTVLLNFTQSGCAPCQAMEPVLAQLEAGGMPIQTINVVQHPEMARRFNVAGTPTFVMLVDGREANRVSGFTTAEKLHALFPVSEAPAAGEVRGQSPEAGGGYLGQRLGSMLGKGKPADSQPAGPSGDPFAKRQSFGTGASSSGNNVAPAVHQEAAPQATRSATNQDPQASAMAASVRLKVEDAKGHSIGSGTIIDARKGEALLITCGHIFRESQGKGRIVVDLFHPQPRTVEGKLLDYDLKRDIALVTISGADLVAVPVAPEGFQVNKNDAAFSIGCDHGQDPTVRQTSITGLNRYQGPPNIEAKGQPVDGRSGGGLFSREGRLIGVCNAADPADDEGIYAAMATIHWQLEKVNLAQLFQPSAAEEGHGDIAAARLAEAGPNVPELSPRPSPDVEPASFTGSTSTSSRTEPLAPLSNERDTEVICIVRSKNSPSAKGQVFVIERASPALLQQIAESSANPAVKADLALSADRRSALSPPQPNPGPLVRGQSQR